MGNIPSEENTSASTPSPQQQWLINPSTDLKGNLCVSHLIFASIGIPMNLCVVIFIIALERLHLHRTFSWLGVGFSNIFLFLSHLAEVQAVYWPSKAADQLCAWLTGLPYLWILVSHFIWFLDRHLCHRHASWYKRHFASCRIVLAAHFGSFAILFLFVKGSHICAAFPFQWQLGRSELTVGIPVAFITFIVCLGIPIALWATSKLAHPSTTVAQNIALQSMNIRDNVEIGLSLEEEGIGEPRDVDETTSSFVHVNGERVSRLDVEAASASTFESLVVLLFFIPPLISLIYLTLCFQKSGEEMTNCSSNAGQVMFYLRELVSIPCSSISPIGFVIQSRDIRIALRDRGFRWF